MTTWTPRTKLNTTFTKRTNPSSVKFPYWSNIEEKWSEVDETWSGYTVSVYDKRTKPVTIWTTL